MNDQFKERNWQECVENADHFLALDWREVYLGHGEWSEDRPWSYVTHCTSGGSHRLDMDTDVWFYARHPCGLTFRWSFDLEPASANGGGHYQIDINGIAQVLRRLPDDARDSFRAYLQTCAEAVEKKAQEWQEITTKQWGTAAALREAARQ